MVVGVVVVVGDARASYNWVFCLVCRLTYLELMRATGWYRGLDTIVCVYRVQSCVFDELRSLGLA